MSGTTSIDVHAYYRQITDVDIAQIAHDCGFSSQQHLCNAFRRHQATTPGRYRSHKRSSTVR